MTTIPNFEVALSTLTGAQGAAVPILALSFAWEDVDSAPPTPWDPSRSALAVVDKGVQVTLNDQVLLFPLNAPEFPVEQGLERAVFLDLLSAQQQLFVCAFNAQGDMVASLGFLSPGP